MAGRRRARARAGFVGQVADDQLGEIFAHDMTSLGVRFETPPLTGGAADRPLPDPGHARRPADDEHLPRREPRADRRSARRGADPLGRGHLPRRLSVGSRAAARGDAEGGRDRPRGRTHGRLHFVRKPVHPRPPRGRHGDDRRRHGRHPVRQRGRDPPSRPAATHSTIASPSCRRRSPRWSITRGAAGALAVEAGRACRGPGGAGRQGRRHDRRRRPVRRRLPRRALPRARRSRRCLDAGSLAAAEVISHFGARPEADLQALVRL